MNKISKMKLPRCPNGTTRSKKTGNCEKKRSYKKTKSEQINKEKISDNDSENHLINTEIKFDGTIINIDSIKFFMNKKKSENDKNNKNREAIITSILNEKIPNSFYEDSKEWDTLKNSLNSWIKELCKKNNIDNINTLSCKIKGGRSNNYDFVININDIQFNVEFKYGASSVNKIPQFVSPMKPSQYLNNSYEEYHYDNCLPIILNNTNIKKPDKKLYIKQIHSPNPECIKDIQDMYYRGCKQSSQYSGNENDIDFYKKSKKITKEGISDFISDTDLDYEKLSKYLLETQKNKFYMLYHNGTFYLETIDEKQYNIVNVTKEPKKNRYIATTEAGKKIKILLRWKNGNGIAFPAFQIS